MLAQWEALAKTGSVRLVLLMYKQPSASDAKALRRERIPVAGAIASSNWPKSLVPSEYLVHGGVIRARAEGVEEVRAMILATHRLVAK